MTELNRDAAIKAALAFCRALKESGEYVHVSQYDRNRTGVAKWEIILDGVMNLEDMVDAILAAARV